MSWVLLVSALWLGAEGPADDAAQARAAFQAGQARYRAGRFAEALEAFSAAQALRPHPSVTFNLARCHDRLGNLARALRAYREYLRLVPRAPDVPQVLAAIARLERTLAEKGLQQLTVLTQPPGAAVRLDGASLGLSPVTTEVGVGPHTLELTLAGHQPGKRSVVLSPASGLEVTVDLSPLALAAVLPEPPPPPPPQESPVVTPTAAPEDAPTVSPPSLVTQPESPAPTRQRTWTWAVAGAAGAFLATGVTLGVLAAGESTALQAELRPGVEAQGYFDRATGYMVGANVAYGLAAAAAITALVLFFLEGP
jgi:tetratricopeptide (TPR) repeat protein